MADLFRCDKCGIIGHNSDKAGRLIIVEIGPDGQPHPTLYNRQADVCAPCFLELRQTMDQIHKPTPSFEDAATIVRNSRILGA